MRFGALVIAVGLSFAISRTAKATTYSGWVDWLGQDRIAGWACVSSPTYDLPVWVHIYDGTTYITSTPANSEYRPDAASFCGGKTWTGYSVATPKFSGWSNHTIHVYASTSSTPSQTNPLPGATTLTYGYPFTGSNTFGVVESITPTTISGWACDKDGPSTQLRIMVNVQYFGTGSIYSLTSSVTTINRADVAPVCGSGTNKGFQISLPSLPGGSHNIIASALNIGPGVTQTLNKHDSVPAVTAFPYAPSLMLDPQLVTAANCWWGAVNLSATNLSGCQPAYGLWQFAVTQTYNFTTGQYQLPSTPSTPYSGANARIRYQATNSNGGFTMKVDTWDNPASGQVMNRCDYNFQALETNIGQTAIASVNGLSLDAVVTVKGDGSLLFSPNNATDGTGCSNAIETGSNPWMHLIFGAVFETVSTPKKGYFVELVPFWEAGAMTGSYASYPDFPGNNKPHANNNPAQYAASDPTHTGGGIGGSETPNYTLNARVATTDERVRDYVLHAGPMAPGETRPFHVDMLAVFQAIFPGVNVDDLLFNGGYIGTEQFNKGRIGIDITRFSFAAQ